MRFARMRTISWLAVVTAIAAAGFALPASGQGAVHHSAKGPYLFVYTEPVQKDCALTGVCYKQAKPIIMPDEITFSRLDNEKATLKTRVGERIPRPSRAARPTRPILRASPRAGLGLVSGTETSGERDRANMLWAEVGNTVVSQITPPYNYNDGGFTKSPARNWWFYCLEYTPYKAFNRPDPRGG